MMTSYVLKLLILVPLVCGMAFGALWLWRKVQPGMNLGQRDRRLKLVEALPVGATGRLAVVEFADRQLLLAISRGRVELLAEAAIGAKPAGTSDVRA
jgi:flagellar protein FliO/FliZ